MRDRYSDETVNKLVRQALSLERQNKFADALAIYYELASEENEYAIERIPLVKYKEEQYRLRKVNLFLGTVSICTIVAAITTVTFNTINNILTTDSIAKKIDTTYVSKMNKPKHLDYSTIGVNYSTVDTIEKEALNSELDIYVPENITTNKLKKRVQEGIESYSAEISTLDSNLFVLIKTNINKHPVGYIKFNKNNMDNCEVFLLKQ